MKKSLTYGMVGGGVGAFIGDVHRKAAAFDGKCTLVAGCFSRSFEKTKKTGESLGIEQDRLYTDFNEMAKAEASKENGIDFVVIVTPNYAHYPACKAFLSNGIHVVCDKPLVFNNEEAEELAQLAGEKGLLFCVTYTYSGYPMVRQARQMVKNGQIGDIIMVQGEYVQGWMAEDPEDISDKKSGWRANPEFAGVSNCVGDIGSHIENTVSYITGLKISEVCAKLENLGRDRVLDTNASILVKYDNNASGMYWASQMAIGHDNGLRVRVYGTKGSLEWFQEDPNYLKVSFYNGPTQIYGRGHSYLYDQAASRIPSGHPEGYYEAFATIYSDFADALNQLKSGKDISEVEIHYPPVEAGVEGVRFINACVDSSKNGAVWTKL